ncbi:MAG: TrmB family transcriptional regulator [Candidatus Woesearchaeota archaeon]
MNLSLLGLTDNEEKAYITSIRLGKVSASEISRESGVSYGKIYEVLARLEAKGLIQIVPEQTKKFLASNPENLIKLIEKKEEEFNKMKEEVDKLKKEYTFHEEEPVKIARGKNNFNKVTRGLNYKKREFTYALKWSVDLKPEYIRRIKEDINAKIPIKTLTSIRNDNKENIKQWLKIDPSFRKIENNGIVLDINNNYVLIVLINQNTIITIKDESFIKLMKEFFENTYELCPKITEEDLS